MKKLKKLFVSTGVNWFKHEPFKESASLSFFAVMALPALLIILITIGGTILKQFNLQTELVSVSQNIFGDIGSEIISGITQNASEFKTFQLATFLGIIILLISASGFIGHLQNALNKFWEIKMPAGLGWKQLLKNKAILFLVLIFLGALVILSLLAEAVITFGYGILAEYTFLPVTQIQLVTHLISFLLIIALFAIMFKTLPAAKSNWLDVSIGAAATAILFSLGKYAIGWYVGKSAITGLYGATGSLVALFLWIYYSILIIFLGAEFTKTYANLYGHKITPRHIIPKKNWFLRFLKK